MNDFLVNVLYINYFDNSGGVVCLVYKIYFGFRDISWKL